MISTFLCNTRTNNPYYKLYINEFNVRFENDFILKMPEIDLYFIDFSFI